MTAATDGLLGATVRLGRALRARGVRATSVESVDGVRALDAVDLGDRREVYLALRAVFVGRPDDRAAFDEAFAAVWDAAAADAGPDAATEPSAEESRESPAPPRTAEERGAVSLERWLRRAEAGPDAEPIGLPTASAEERLAEKDFSSFDADDLEAVERVARRLARRMARRSSRRWKPTRRGPRVDPRRTVRRALRTGGEPVEIAFRRRRPKKTKLVALCDVSGSMDVYSRFLLQFLYALQNCFARVETFAFGTRLSRVTPQLRGRSWGRALDRLSADVRDWSGGTRIGECLAAFVERWPRLVDRRTVVVILSDGWDTGEPEVLRRALRTIGRRAGRVVWLNPLLGSPDYRPETRGMKAALPHLDIFAPAHDLGALEALENHLRL